MLILGIDDAGRGPLIGPMILAGVLITKDQEKKLKKENIRDSKLITHPERIKLSKFLKENSLENKVLLTTPEEIDNCENLNTLEAKKMAGIINAINSGKYRKEKINVIVDCPSVNTSAWGKVLAGFIEHPDNLEVACEHKADANHIAAGAASILAKVTREEEVEKIKKKYGNIGSGYPSDPVTKNFLMKHGNELKDSGIFRKSWATWKNLFPTTGQSTLQRY